MTLISKIFVSVCLFAYSFFNFTSTSNLKILLNLNEEEAVFTFFDLSDGEAVYIENATGKTILINTGSGQSQHELKKRLDLFNVETIDHLILTGSEDHFAGNAEWLIDTYDVKALHTTKRIHAKKQLQVPSFIPLEENVEQQIFPGLATKVIYEPDDGAISMFLQYGEHKILFMGYANKCIEEKLIKRGNLNAHLLKVSEFGDNKATSQRFLDYVDPEVAIVFKRKNNKPSAQVMERLNESWIETYFPYRFGLVIMKSDYNHYEMTKIRVHE